MTRRVSVEEYRAIDLCSGMGGIRLGVEQAGWQSVFSNDIEKLCKVVHDANFHGPEFVVGDLHDIKGVNLPEAEMFCAGFPCQAFSVAGKQGGLEDKGTGGNIFYELVRIIGEMSRPPQALFFENVKNLMGHDHGRTWRIISKALWDLGYSVEGQILNSCDFGVPQNRERIYIVGFRDEAQMGAFCFPEPSSAPPTFRSIMEGAVDEKYYYSGKKYVRSDGTLLSKFLDGLMSQKFVPYQYRRHYVRSFKKGLCPTLTANMGGGGHNVPLVRDDHGIRKITPRECARLQGFPDSFVLPEELSQSRLYKMIGNSVTVGVIKRIALAIKAVF